jgi:hypothetical protein
MAAPARRGIAGDRLPSDRLAQGPVHRPVDVAAGPRRQASWPAVLLALAAIPAALTEQLRIEVGQMGRGDRLELEAAQGRQDMKIQQLAVALDRPRVADRGQVGQEPAIDIGPQQWAMEDPLARLRAVNEEIAAAQARVREQTAALRAERAQLVGKLREQGWTLGRLAKEFGVTRTQIQQYEAGDGDG